jgi:hypothetical protein
VDLGLSGNTTDLLATGVYGVVRTIAVFCFLLFVADALGRRWSLTISGTIMGLMMFYLGVSIAHHGSSPETVFDCMC